MSVFYPMLATGIEHIRHVPDIHEPEWIAEQKIDGERVIIQVCNGKIRCTSRNGTYSRAAHQIGILAEPLKALNGNWIFDGEYLNGNVWLFDLPFAESGKVAISYDMPGKMVSPWHDRRAMLEVVWSRLLDGSNIKLLPYAQSTKDKNDLLHWVRDNSGEGVMYKHFRSYYLPGKRTELWIKYKFVKSCDCVVTATMVDGKRRAEIGLVYNDPETGVANIADVGAVKIVPESMCGKLKVGDVIEVHYLYATTDNRLFQPRMKRVRTDKHILECTIDQLEYTDKTKLWTPDDL